MVVPSAITAPLEMIETELSLEVFVCAFGSPALFYLADEALRGEEARGGDEVVFIRLRFTILPFHQTSPLGRIDPRLLA